MAAASKPVAVAVTPERKHLAEMLARRDRLLRESNTLATAARAAMTVAHEAQRSLDAAAEAVKTATERAATHTIEALAGNVLEAPVDAESARQEQRRAQDRLDAANAARAEIDRRQRVTDDQLRGVPHMVDAAIREVMFSETRAQRDALTQRIYDLQVQFIDAVWSLGLLMRLRPRPLAPEDREHDAASMQDQVHPAHWKIPGIDARYTPPMLSRWRAWEAALAQDPMAAPPE